VELLPSQAPQTVANFVRLAQSGFYNNLTWHRIEKNFVIQIGDPNTLNGGGNRSKWGQGSSGTSVPFENSTLSNSLGSVAMASTGAGVGGKSQFYINLKDNPSLDGKYAVFGTVISGIDVVQAIGNLPTEAVAVAGGGTQNEPVTPVLIASVNIQNVP
jgi:cyclophilin family peptidyl-prolyl cis-trans isomerase